MRPAGDVSAALLQALEQLAQPQRGPTMRELAQAAQVGVVPAQQTLKNMRRYGRVSIVRHRRVAYRNRPVAEYALPGQAGADAVNAQAFLAQCWG